MQDPLRGPQRERRADDEGDESRKDDLGHQRALVRDEQGLIAVGMHPDGGLELRLDVRVQLLALVGRGKIDLLRADQAKEGHLIGRGNGGFGMVVDHADHEQREGDRQSDAETEDCSEQVFQIFFHDSKLVVQDGLN